MRDRGRGWAGTTCRESRRTVREATCARGTESYRLHSSTSLSLAVWGRLTAQWQHLALCFPFVKIWLHWITITTSTSCPLRSPPRPPLLPSFPASLYPFPTPQSNPSSWILSEWHPLNLPNYLSSGHATVALSRQHILLMGWSRGAGGSSTGLLTAHLEGRTLCDTLSPSVSSSKLWVTVGS